MCGLSLKDFSGTQQTDTSLLHTTVAKKNNIIDVTKNVITRVIKEIFAPLKMFDWLRACFDSFNHK